MKEVWHRKETTSCQAFIQRKLMPKHIDTKTVWYGKSNEGAEINAYLSHQRHGRIVKVSTCGLCIDPPELWLTV